MIKAYIFDLNGVFLKSEYLTKRISDRWGVDVEKVMKVLNNSMDIVRQPNAPKIFDLWKDNLKEWGVEINGDEFLQWWFSGEQLQQEIVDLCKKLKEKGFKVFILSNNFRERTNYYRNNFPEIFDAVDNAYFSWETGFVKPSQEAFKHVLKENHLHPEDVVYIDDSEKNLYIAKGLGIETDVDLQALINENK